MLGQGFNEFKLFQHVTTPEDSVEKGFFNGHSIDRSGNVVTTLQGRHWAQGQITCSNLVAKEEARA